MNTRIPVGRLVAALGLTTLATFLCTTIPDALARQVLVSPQASEVALLRAGLSVKALTAAGLSVQQVGGVVDDVQVYLVEHPGSLDSVDAAHASALSTRDGLQRTIQSGVFGEGALSNYATALTTYSTAHAQQQAVLNSIWNAGVADAPQASSAILTTIRANSAWDMPIEFLTVNRAEPDWIALREALANERISAASGVEPDPEAQALLAQLRADPTVSAAIANLAANLTAATNAWNAALSD